RIGSARALDEHLLEEPDPAGVLLGRDSLDDLDQPLETRVLYAVSNLVGQARSFCPGPWREDERECGVVAHGLHDLERLLEVLVALSGEADDEISPERE